MTPPNDPIAERRLVWIALSELFLDVEPAPHDLDRLAADLASFLFTIDELEEILRLEVTPLLRFNLHSVAGEWAGFDPEWLAAEIPRTAQHNTIWNRSVSQLVRSEWETIRTGILKIRSGGPP